MLAGMVQSPPQFDPVRPTRAAARRNLVIDQMRRAPGRSPPDQAAQAAGGAARGRPAAAGARPRAASGPGTPGSSASYVLTTSTRPGSAAQQLAAAATRSAPRSTAARSRRRKAAVDGQVPAGPAARRRRDGRSSRRVPTSHPVTAMAANRTYGLDEGAPDQLRPARRAREPRRRLGVQDLHVGASLAQGGGIDDDHPGAAERLRVADLHQRRDPDPGAQRRQLPARSCRCTDALAQSPNTAFVKLEETTGVPPVVDMAVKLGLRSLAESPAGRRARHAVDRRR